jgi:hypothetical protein
MASYANPKTKTALPGRAAAATETMDEFQPRRRHRRSREKRRIPQKRRQIVIAAIVIIAIVAMVWATLTHGGGGLATGSDVDQYGRSVDSKPS